MFLHYKAEEKRSKLGHIVEIQVAQGAGESV